MKKNKLFKILSLTLAISSLGAMTPSMAHAEWKSNNNNWYYLDSTGKARTGWVKDNGDWYYIGSDGVMKTGWIQDGGNWYYLWSNGQMAVDTNIYGYYVNSSGAWTVDANSSLTWLDTEGKNVMDTDLSIRASDETANSILTNYNIDLSNGKDKTNLHNLVYNVTKEILHLDEAKSKCIGKVVGGKYVIKDIKFFSQIFKTTQGTAADERVKTVKENSVYDYKTTSTYFYDETIVYSCYNERSNEWEARRVVIDFEKI